MKKLLLVMTLALFCLLLVACDAGDITTPAATGDGATTTAPDTTTTATVTTLAPEKVLEEIKEPERFENVTLSMVGAVDGDDFDYDLLFDATGCLMIEKDDDDDYVEFFAGEEGASVRAMFVDTALALLAHGDEFTLTESGYRCDTAITYDCEVLGVGPATITATNNLVTLDANGALHTLSCNMQQVCDMGTVNVTVTFTFTSYGSTVITPPEPVSPAE